MKAARTPSRSSSVATISAEQPPRIPEKHRSAKKPEKCPACGSDRVLPALYARFAEQEHDAQGRPKLFPVDEPTKPDRNKYNNWAFWGCESCKELLYPLAARCPKCGSENILGLSFGYPSKDTFEDTFEAVERGERMLGGCNPMDRHGHDVGCADCRTLFLSPRLR